MKLLTLKFILIFIYLISSSSSYAIQQLNLKNLIIHKDPIKLEKINFKNKNIKATNAKIVWAKHPSRIHQNNMIICKLCNSPTPEGEIKRWGKCSFCWRRNK